MISGPLMVGLLAFYLVLAGVCAWEWRPAEVLYWLSAAGILTAVLWMR